MIAAADAVRRILMETARRTGLDSAAQPFLGGAGVILMLHRVTDRLDLSGSANSHLAITPGFLDGVLSALKREGFRFVSLDEAIQRLRADGSAERFAVITADDGYRDNLEEALPVFEAHDAPFTVYIAPGLIDGTADLWWDIAEQIVHRADRVEAPGLALDCATPAQKKAAFARFVLFLAYEVEEWRRRDLLRGLAARAGVDPDRWQRGVLMNWAEIVRLAAHPLATIGAHTLNHYNLKRLPEHVVTRELEEGRRVLAARLGAVPRHFAYPYGYARAAGPREMRLAAQAGYASAVTTRHGVLRSAHLGHLHALPRISLNGRFQCVDHVRTMVKGFTTPFANAGRRLVTM